MFKSTSITYVNMYRIPFDCFEGTTLQLDYICYKLTGVIGIMLVLTVYKVFSYGGSFNPT